jgi:hypothetical protein
MAVLFPSRVQRVESQGKVVLMCCRYDHGWPTYGRARATERLFSPLSLYFRTEFFQTVLRPTFHQAFPARVCTNGVVGTIEAASSDKVAGGRV